MRNLADRDLKDEFVLENFILGCDIDDLTIVNMQSAIHKAIEVSEAGTVMGSASALVGAGLTAMAVTTGGLTIFTSIPAIAVVSSALLAWKSFHATNARQSEYRIISDPATRSYVESAQELLDKGTSPKVVANDARARMITAMATSSKINQDALPQAQTYAQIVATQDEYLEPVHAPIVTHSTPEPFCPKKEDVLDFFALDIFEVRSIEGFSQCGKTSFVTEFALLAQKKGMEVWVLNLGYSDVSPLIEVASRSVLCHWKYSEDATREDRRDKLAAARQMLKDFSRQSYTLLVIDEVAVLHHYPELSEVLEELQGAINEHSIDGAKRNSGILMSGTPVIQKKGVKGTSLVGVASIPLVDTKGMNEVSHPEGSTTSPLGRRFLELNGEMTCIDNVASYRPIVLSNVFDPTVQTIEAVSAAVTIHDDSFTVGFGAAAVTIHEMPVDALTSAMTW